MGWVGGPLPLCPDSSPKAKRQYGSTSVYSAQTGTPLLQALPVHPTVCSSPGPMEQHTDFEIMKPELGEATRALIFAVSIPKAFGAC